MAPEKQQNQQPENFEQDVNNRAYYLGQERKDDRNLTPPEHDHIAAKHLQALKNEIVGEIQEPINQGIAAADHAQTSVNEAKRERILTGEMTGVAEKSSWRAEDSAKKASDAADQAKTNNEDSARNSSRAEAEAQRAEDARDKAVSNAETAKSAADKTKDNENQSRKSADRSSNAFSNSLKSALRSFGHAKRAGEHEKKSGEFAARAQQSAAAAQDARTGAETAEKNASETEERIKTIVATPGPQGPEGPQGPQGIPGKDGKDGSDGKNGTDGKSIYEIAKEKGYPGTEQEWLDSQKGEKGDPGIPGIPGEDGRNGIDGHDGARGPQGEKGEKGDTGTTRIPRWMVPALIGLTLLAAGGYFFPRPAENTGTVIYTPTTGTAAGTPLPEDDALRFAYKQIHPSDEYSIDGPAIVVGDVEPFDNDSATGQIQIILENQTMKGTAVNGGDVIYDYKQSEQQAIIDQKVTEMKLIGGDGPSNPPKTVLILDANGNVIGTK